MLSFFRDEPYSLSEIRHILEDESLRPKPLITILERHHGFIKESLPTLLDKVAPTDEKQRHLTRFLHLLRMHHRAEEEVLYPALLNAPEREAHIEALVGIDEHQIVQSLSDELFDADYETYWSEEVDAKSRLLASQVQNHIRDEERTTFNVAKRDIDSDALLGLASVYIDKCREYLEREINDSRRILNERAIQRSL